MQSVKAAEERGRIRARLCKLAFESLYGPLAWAYDWVSRTFFMGQWGLWQRAALPHLRGPRVLEVGMGTGDLQVVLAATGWEVWGIDYSPQMVRLAARKLRARRAPVMRLARAKAQALPFPGGYFNSVVSTFPSEYISDPRTLAEVARVLAPGGRLVIVPGGWLRPRGARARALEGVARIVYGYERTPTVQTARELQQQLARNQNWYGWVGTLKGRMQEAGFRVEGRLATNSKSTCLVVTGERAGGQVSNFDQE